MEHIGDALERLHEDESLSADVDDSAAEALLRWGEEEIKAGRPEEAVRRGIRALNKVIARRAELDPAAARERLAQAGLSVSDAALAALWTEALPEGEWAQRLLETLTHTPRPSAADFEAGEGKGGRKAVATPWWQRFLFWRKAR